MEHTNKGCTSSMAYMTGKNKNDDDWVIDSGSTEDITYNNHILQNRTQRRFEILVVIPIGEAIPIEGRGECNLLGGTKIKDVLYIPKFTCNLLSVSRLCKDLQAVITFFPDFCVMQELHTRSLIRAGECKQETKGDKFEMRGRPGVFLGYPQGTKGYKLYDIENNKIVTSRDVRLMIFPFKKLDTNQEEFESFFGPTYEDEPNIQGRITGEEDVIPTKNENPNIDLETHVGNQNDGIINPPSQQTVGSEPCVTQQSSHAHVDEMHV
ncbi:hypothetical protein E3N88_21276 [Mikania micrantha]|uniref:F-box domain-containing protein n=1 Tax=Mikania micrantha TaxID=192012 RepID=A0A5N6NL82_9ASTR|nr:hypothetical protein E3N88_21276 [Mikania micrantha]